MIIDETIRDALDLGALDLPPVPLVVGIEPEDYVDSAGEDAIRVWVTLDEHTDDNSLTGEAVMRIKSAIRNSLRARDVSYFPYVFLRKLGEITTEESAE